MISEEINRLIDELNNSLEESENQIETYVSLIETLLAQVDHMQSFAIYNGLNENDYQDYMLEFHKRTIH